MNAMYTRNNGYFNTDDSHDYSTNHSAERFNIRSNIDFAVTRTTQLDVNLYGWYQSQNGPGSGAENIYKNLVTLPQGIFPNGTMTKDIQINTAMLSMQKMGKL